MMDRSDQVNELFTALAKAQAEIEPAGKDSINSHLKNRYASLAAVIKACREPLAKHGLCVLQTTEPDDPNWVSLRTTLGHTSGQYVSSVIRIASQKPDAQSIGSTLTYARRYGLSSLLGVCADDDDDGNEAATPQDRGGYQGRPNGTAPESRGDAQASRQPTPARAAQAVAKGEGQPDYATATKTAASPAPPEAPDPARQAQSAWHARLKEHCGGLNDETRHAFANLLLKPRRPITSEQGWTETHYRRAFDALCQHAGTCPATDSPDAACPLLDAAMEAAGAPVDPFDGDAGAVPAGEAQNACDL